MKRGRPASPAPIATVVDAATEQKAAVKSAIRTLAILEFFDDVRRPARVGEIAQTLRYPQSSVTYLLKSLVGAGYLEFEPASRSFRPTPRVALLGYRISGPAITDGTLIRLLRAIADQTQLTVTLAARNGIYAQYIHVLERNSGFPVHIPVGTCRLIVWSAAGFALLAREEDRTIRALVQRTNAEVATAPAPISLDVVRSNVEQFRRRGFFFSDSLVTPGGGHISMGLPEAVTGGRNIVLGAAGSAVAIRRNESEIVATMQRVVREFCSHADAAIDIGQDVQEASRPQADRAPGGTASATSTVPVSDSVMNSRVRSGPP